jgi:hypothetical protein
VTDPLGYLTGSCRSPPPDADEWDGIGSFQLVGRDSGVTMPKSLLQEHSQLLLRTPENPAGINMDEFCVARVHS